MTWHSTPPIITGLHARRLPSSGGDTAFANQHLAYETLDEETRERISDLKALYVNGNFTKHIVDMPDAESELLLFRLFAHASRPEFTYRHHWERGDLVLWDNRAVMHYAIRDYEEQRIMHRIVIKGGKPR